MGPTSVQVTDKVYACLLLCVKSTKKSQPFLSRGSVSSEVMHICWNSDSNQLCFKPGQKKIPVRPRWITQCVTRTPLLVSYSQIHSRSSLAQPSSSECHHRDILAWTADAQIMMVALWENWQSTWCTAGALWDQQIVRNQRIHGRGVNWLK